MAKSSSRRDRRRAQPSRRSRKTLTRAERYLYSGQGAKAVPLIEEVLSTEPDNAGAHHLAGVVCHQTGQPDAALSHARRAIELEPEQAGYVNGLGAILQSAGHLEEATAAFSRAASLDPSDPQAAANLGFSLRQSGDFHGALDAFAKAVQLDPSHINAYLGWVDLLGRVKTPAYEPSIAEPLRRALEGPLSAPEELAPAIAAQLRLRFSISDFPSGDALPDIDPDEPLLAAYLTHCLNIDPAIERTLTAHRRRLLISGSQNWTSHDRDLAGLIARQAFITEFALFAEADETSAIDNLIASTGEILSADGACSDEDLLAIAMYTPLSDVAGAETLGKAEDRDRHPQLKAVIQLEIRDRQTETCIKADIPSLSEIEDETTKKVRGQYEEHPYPRWTVPTPQAAQQPAQLLRTMFPHFAPPDFLQGAFSVLIAGCGTGRHTASVAQSFPESQITAIDISLSSIAYGMRKFRELGIAKTATIFQADILNARQLDQEFDMIQSVGVLHHMAEPVAGWQVLGDLLRPGGVMKIGLYSERGRAGVLKCRDIIANEGIGSTDADMRAFRHRLLSDPPGDPFTKVMQRADFYSLSMCRDLLFHVQEVCYTPARIASELNTLGLTFIGFEETEALGLNAIYRERYPDCANLDNLDNWEALEATLDDPPEGYVFWCQKPFT